MSIENIMLIRQKQTGFTLVEVLVAVLIFAVGMLGIAGLQLNAHQSSSFSQARTAATLAATSLVERMRANRTGTLAGNYTFNAVVNNGALIPAAIPACTDGSNNGCGTAVFVAQNDLNEWLNQLNNSLPILNAATTALANNANNAAMVVVCQDGTPTTGSPAALGGGIACDGDPNQWTIYIDWQDTRNLTNNAVANINRYTFTFVP